MNTSLVNAVCEQVVKFICEKVADDLIESLHRALEDGKETDEVCDAIRERLQQVYTDIPKTTTAVSAGASSSSVARPPATTGAAGAAAASSAAKGPGSRGASSSRGASDKLKDAQGNFIKCMGVTKKDNTPCKHDAKVTVVEGGVTKYYCGVHGRAGSGAQPNPNAKPTGSGKGVKSTTAPSSFISTVNGASDGYSDVSLNLDDNDIDNIQ